MSKHHHRTNYSGWAVRDRSRLIAELAGAGCVPVHTRTVAEHVTYRYPDAEPAPAVPLVRVVGWASDERADVALVEVSGSTARPDGRPYHLTVALAAGQSPRISNLVLADAVRNGTIRPVTAIEVLVDAF